MIQPKPFFEPFFEHIDPVPVGSDTPVSTRKGGFLTGLGEFLTILQLFAAGRLGYNQPRLTELPH
jgi:hypothetical protein